MARVTSKKETKQRGPNNAHEHRIFRAEDKSLLPTLSPNFAAYEVGLIAS